MKKKVVDSDEHPLSLGQMVIIGASSVILFVVLIVSLILGHR